MSGLICERNIAARQCDALFRDIGSENNTGRGTAGGRVEDAKIFSASDQNGQDWSISGTSQVDPLGDKVRHAHIVGSFGCPVKS